MRAHRNRITSYLKSWLGPLFGLRWYIARLPELELFPTEEERELAIDDLGKNREHEGAWLLMFILVVTIAILAEPLLASRVTIPSWLSGSIMPLILMPSVFGITWWRLRRVAHRFLRSKLIESGVPVCVKCGYCLRGLTSDRCPECGKELDARVRALNRDDAQPDGVGSSEGSAPSRSRL